MKFRRRWRKCTLCPGSSGRKRNPWKMAQFYKVASQTVLKIISDNGPVYSFVAFPALKPGKVGVQPLVPTCWSASRTDTNLWKYHQTEEFCLLMMILFCLIHKKSDCKGITIISCNCYLIKDNSKFSWHSWAKLITATLEGTNSILFLLHFSFPALILLHM